MCMCLGEKELTQHQDVAERDESMEGPSWVSNPRPGDQLYISLVPRPCGRRETAWYHSQKNLGIRLHLEIVSKINTHTSDIFLYHRKIQLFASRITFNSMNVEDNVYEAKDAFLRLVSVSQYAMRCCHLRA